MKTTLTLIILITSAAYGAEEDSPLREAHSLLRSTAQCREAVGFQLNQSLPLPVRTAKGLRFREMFFRTFSERAENDPDSQVMPPRIFAEYDVDFKDVDCDIDIPMPDSEFGNPVGSSHTPVTRKMKHAEWKKQVGRLLVLEEELSVDFGKGTPAPMNEAKAKEFSTLFKKLAQPGLKPYYRALSPDFWKWLEGLDAKKEPAK